MVSINKNFDANQAGATFFNSTTDEDGRLVSPVIRNNVQHEFEPLKTVPFATIHLVVSTAISVVGIVFALREPDVEHRCRAYYIMMYLHIAFWFITLVIDYILKKSHHNLRVSGYLEFYQKSYTLHRLPVYIVSMWNALLLIVQTLSHHFYPEHFSDQCIKPGITTPLSYITAIVFTENIVLLIIHGQYIQKVVNFNSAKQRPDVQREQLAGRPPISQTLTQTADLLARQADLIRHLREHNEKLSTKLSETSSQLRTLQGQQTSPTSPQPHSTSQETA